MMVEVYLQHFLCPLESVVDCYSGCLSVKQLLLDTGYRVWSQQQHWTRASRHLEGSVVMNEEVDPPVLVVVPGATKFED